MRRIFAHLLLSIVTLLFALPMTAGAQQASVGPACDCWCEGTKSAQQLKGKTTAEACVASCANEGQKFLACARTLDEHPDTYAYCFTREQCTGFASPDGNVTGEFQDEASKCSPERGYCFPINAKPIKLNIHLGTGVTTVTDLGDYINKGYNFALGASVTVAIVILMIGGLRYVMAAQTGETAKAKAMIQNAVIGLVLLIGAFVILYTVNPQLTKLQAPSVPMARPTAITAGFNCEKLVEQKYTIVDKDGKELKAGKCGEKGVIQKNEKGVEVGSGTLCTFSGCDAGKQCAIGPKGEGVCTSCQEVVPGATAGSSTLIPSQTTCSQLTKTSSDRNIIPFCTYTQDPSVIVSGFQMSFAAALTAVPVAGPLIAAGFSASQAADIIAGTCAEFTVNCAAIHACANYEDVQVSNARIAGTKDLDDLEPGALSGEWNLQSVCAKDPCFVGKNKGGCIYTSSTTDDTCTEGNK